MVAMRSIGVLLPTQSEPAFVDGVPHCGTLSLFAHRKTLHLLMVLAMKKFSLRAQTTSIIKMGILLVN